MGNRKGQTQYPEWLRKEEARLLEEYIHFNNYERIQLKAKLTPFEMRCQSCAI